MDPEIDFGAIFSRYDTLVMGRGSYEAMQTMDGGGVWEGMKNVVASTTIQPSDHPSLEIVNDAVSFVKAEKLKAGGYLAIRWRGDLSADARCRLGRRR